MRMTGRRLLTTAGVAGLGLAAGRSIAHAQAARPITVAHSVSTFYKPYMDTFKREDVLKSVRYYRTIFARAVDLSFVRKAQTKYKS